jgi:hypothetical protein
MKKYSLYLIVLILLMACKEKRQELLNIKASVQLNDELKENPLLMHPLTSSVNPKDSMMSTLYGNDIAFDYAKKNLGSNYPNGAVLYEVKWKQKPDELWFGANVPGEKKSVEKITFKEENSSEYEFFEGKILKKIKRDSATENSRKEIIVSQRMAVSP